MQTILQTVISYLKDALYVIPVVLISLTVHECAHGFVAYKLGDPTAKEEGRLTLNPLKHLDPFGFIMMLIVHFGWAKPVPVNPMYFKNPKKGMMLTALAGPVSNLILAVISSLVTTILSLTIWLVVPSPALEVVQHFFLYLTIINIGLAIFNLIPVHPLDGSRILNYFMPHKYTNFMLKYGDYIYIAFIVIVLATDFIGDAITTVQYGVMNLLFSMWLYPISFIISLF